MPNGEPRNASKTPHVPRRPNRMPQVAGQMRPSRPEHPPVLDQVFDASELPRLRAAVAAYAELLGSGPAAADDVVLVAHELSSNAVRHGGGSGRLRLWLDGLRIMCRVTDTGPGLADPESQGVSGPSPQVPGGRGLLIARRLATLHIETGPSGTTITAAISLT